jgi:hypothetical protein
MENILQSIPQNSLVRIITSKGDKICIKDNNKSSASVITSATEEHFLMVTDVKNVNGQSATTYIYIDYDDICRVEVACTSRLD